MRKASFKANNFYLFFNKWEDFKAQGSRFSIQDVEVKNQEEKSVKDYEMLKSPVY